MNFLKFNGGYCKAFFQLLFICLSVSLPFLYNIVIATWTDEETTYESQHIALALAAVVVIIYIVDPLKYKILFLVGVVANT